MSSSIPNYIYTSIYNYRSNAIQVFKLCKTKHKGGAKKISILVLDICVINIHNRKFSIELIAFNINW